MNRQELEELYVRSLDSPLNPTEREQLSRAFQESPGLKTDLAHHSRVRDVLKRKEPATFGPFFASRIVNKIQNSGVIIDRQIFSYFRKFQLAAFGVVVALLIANMFFSEQVSVGSILGVGDTTVVEEEVVPFDFYESLNK